MKEDARPMMVTIQCFTYNHEAYIRECLEGFVIQKTNFRFEAIVHDDASTDGTADIIREYEEKYPDIIKPIYETENQYSKHDGSLERIMNEHTHGKYIASCEGDDYWISRDKLQKQVDYLENHSDCGMVYTAYRLQNDITGVNTDKFTSDSIQHDDTFKWKLLEQKVSVGTCTTLIKASLNREVRSIEDDYKGFKMGDTQTWFNAARLSGIGYIPEITGVYRKQQSGATATFDPSRRASFIQGCLDLDLHLAYKYGAPVETIKCIKSLFGFSCFNLYFRIDDYDKARLLNHDYFNSNVIIDKFITFAEFFHIRHFHGWGTLMRTATAVGLISLK